MKMAKVSIHLKRKKNESSKRLNDEMWAILQQRKFYNQRSKLKPKMARSKRTMPRSSITEIGRYTIYLPYPINPNCYSGTDLPSSLFRSI